MKTTLQGYKKRKMESSSIERNASVDMYGNVTPLNTTMQQPSDAIMAPAPSTENLKKKK